MSRDLKPYPLTKKEPVAYYPALDCISCGKIAFYSVGPPQLRTELQSENFVRADTFEHPETHSDIICPFCQASKLEQVEYDGEKPRRGSVQKKILNVPII